MYPFRDILEKVLRFQSICSPRASGWRILLSNETRRMQQTTGLGTRKKLNEQIPFSYATKP